MHSRCLLPRKAAAPVITFTEYKLVQRVIEPIFSANPGQDYRLRIIQEPLLGGSGIEKNQLAAWLEEGRMDAVVRQAEREKRTLSLLSAFLYHPDPLVGWRAVQAMGMAARAISGTDPEYVRGHLRRLFWLVNDESGGIGWRAPEAIGEIISRCPGLFDEFISPLFFLLDMEAEDAPRFRPGILYAIGRVGSQAPVVFFSILPLVLDCLDDDDAQARGMALWCLRQNAYSGPIPRLSDLAADQSQVELYSDDRITPFTVAALAQPWVEAK